MNALFRPTMAALPILCMALWPSSGRSESSLGVHGGSASASVRITVMIPPIVRVLRNVHPGQLEVIAGNRAGGRQELVISTNMHQGFCLDLRNPASPDMPWQVQPVQGSEVTINPTAGGYQICGLRKGTHTVRLQHEFLVPAGASGSGLPWPVQTDLTTL